jgi:hypothetical protein
VSEEQLLRSHKQFEASSVLISSLEASEKSKEFGPWAGWRRWRFSSLISESNIITIGGVYASIPYSDNMIPYSMPRPIENRAYLDTVVSGKRR